MMIGMLQEDYARAVRERRRELEEYIASGKCQNFEEYKSKCGEYAGLKKALELFNDVAKRHGELEDSE
ncbi:MAG: hypothetical protein C4521_07485 [Actinobacteria bacterium]|nr:MAG: hypothetical protein C4521_07485 [Actinomycetota bacterium]